MNDKKEHTSRLRHAENKKKRKKFKEEKLLKEYAKLVQANKDKEIRKHRRSGKADKGVPYTVSIALPGSILDHRKTYKLKTLLAGQIGRALGIFKVNEVVIFDETGVGVEITDFHNCNLMLGRLLMYLECPQYLRKDLFPFHNDLEYAGALMPLDTPHHPAEDIKSLYREGVVTGELHEASCMINVGLQQPVEVQETIPEFSRVTVKVDYDSINNGTGSYSGTVVSPNEPLLLEGLYWGYHVRYASSLGEVFKNSVFEENYDCTIGTSEKGTDIDQFTLPKFNRLLIVFGGMNGLEASLAYDKKLTATDPSELFHHYLNTYPGQGSGTIRTEEAIFVTMSSLRCKIKKSQS